MWSHGVTAYHTLAQLPATSIKEIKSEIFLAVQYLPFRSGSSKTPMRAVDLENSLGRKISAAEVNSRLAHYHLIVFAAKP